VRREERKRALCTRGKRKTLLGSGGGGGRKRRGKRLKVWIGTPSGKSHDYGRGKKKGSKEGRKGWRLSKRRGKTLNQEGKSYQGEKEILYPQGGGCGREGRSGEYTLQVSVKRIKFTSQVGVFRRRQ